MVLSWSPALGRGTSKSINEPLAKQIASQRLNMFLRTNLFSLFFLTDLKFPQWKKKTLFSQFHQNPGFTKCRLGPPVSGRIWICFFLPSWSILIHVFVQFALNAINCYSDRNFAAGLHLQLYARRMEIILNVWTRAWHWCLKIWSKPWLLVWM